MLKHVSSVFHFFLVEKIGKTIDETNKLWVFLVLKCTQHSSLSLVCSFRFAFLFPSKNPILESDHNYTWKFMLHGNIETWWIFHSSSVNGSENKNTTTRRNECLKNLFDDVDDDEGKKANQHKWFFNSYISTALPVYIHHPIMGPGYIKNMCFTLKHHPKKPVSF